MVSDQLTVKCGQLEDRNRRRVVATLGSRQHVDRFDVDQQFTRSKWRAAVIGKFGLGEDSHEFLEAEIIRAAEAADTSTSLWQPIVTTLSDVTASKPDYLWPGRFAFGMLHCADGDGGVGKGVSIMDLAARGSRGDAMPPNNAPAGTFEPWSTLFVTSEDSPEYVLRPRAEAAGAVLDRIATMSSMEVEGVEKRSVKLNLDLLAIERLVKDRRARMVIIDPWSEFLGDGLSINSDQDNRKVLGPLAEVAHNTGAAVLIVRHLSKKEGMSAQYRGVGSTAPLNASRAAYVVAPDPEDPDRRVWASTKFNIGIKPPSLSFRIESHLDSARVVWEGETELTAGDLMKSDSKPSGGKLDHAKQIIESILADGPRGSSEVMGACEDEGISKRTYHTARKGLGVISEKTEFQGQWMLTLPSENGAIF